VDVQVTYKPDRETEVEEERFWRDSGDYLVCRINRVGIEQPVRVELGAKNRNLGGDIEGHNLGRLSDPPQY